MYLREQVVLTTTVCDLIVTDEDLWPQSVYKPCISKISGRQKSTFHNHHLWENPEREVLEGGYLILLDPAQGIGINIFGALAINQKWSTLRSFPHIKIPFSIWP